MNSDDPFRLYAATEAKHLDGLQVLVGCAYFQLGGLVSQPDHHPAGVEIVSQGLNGRRFTLLQGPSSLFFADLGEALQQQGAKVEKVGFCPGERLYWRGSAGSYRAYREPLRKFGPFLVDYVLQQNVSDIIMLGDGRAPHAATITAKRECGLDCNIWVVEHGYLRPNLILIEPDGMGGASRIPEFYRPEAIIKKAPMAPNWPQSFVRYASLDVAYHIANLLAAPMLYPHYRAHSGISPVREYSGWIRKALRRSLRRKCLSRAEMAIANHRGPIFLFPLQLSQDFQLTRYGTGEDQRTILDRVTGSFEINAPDGALLVVKVHPLDNGLIDWGRAVAERTGRRQVIFLDGGDLEGLMPRLSGVVTINSTVGLTALLSGCATCVLGRAVYDLPELTHYQELDSFWAAPTAPDPTSVEHFAQYLRMAFHVPGAFDGPGSKAAAKAIADWLCDPPFMKQE